MREPSEYVQGHVPGAQLVPLATVPEHAGALPTGRPVYVVCASGNRSLRATQYLRGAGVDAYSVRGGTQAWVAAGKPVMTGPHAGA
ncbi:hypothetical protein GCM10010972_28920 [Cellulomonas carbonis]|nr:hypothetical protein GCM10010972_28920 [Cellulomonas carbonis]